MTLKEKWLNIFDITSTCFIFVFEMSYDFQKAG